MMGGQMMNPNLVRPPMMNQGMMMQTMNIRPPSQIPTNTVINNLNGKQDFH